MVYPTSYREDATSSQPMWEVGGYRQLPFFYGFIMNESDRKAIKLAARIIDTTGPSVDPKCHFSPRYKKQWSNSLGVGRNQRDRYISYLKSVGLGYTEVDPGGRPHVKSDRHRRKLCQAQYHVGMDSYYD